MIFPPSFEVPPSDFVAFLAQRSGLSREAAEQRLEGWLGEYRGATSPDTALLGSQAAPLPAAVAI